MDQHLGWCWSIGALLCSLIDLSWRNAPGDSLGPGDIIPHQWMSMCDCNCYDTSSSDWFVNLFPNTGKNKEVSRKSAHVNFAKFVAYRFSSCLVAVWDQCLGSLLHVREVWRSQRIRKRDWRAWPTITATTPDTASILRTLNTATCPQISLTLSAGSGCRVTYSHKNI